MIIGGYQPFTLTDYPGRPAAAIFTQGCNLRCPYCHNASLRPRGRRPGGAPGRQEILAHLQSRREQLGGVVITGGEPTLCRELPGFLREIRGMGFRIKLDTNCTQPQVLDELLQDGLVDCTAADVKAPPDKYVHLAGTEVDMAKIRKSISIIAGSDLPHLFRTTWVPDLLDEADRRQILAMIPPGSPHVWQRFVRENAVDPGLRARR